MKGGLKDNKQLKKNDDCSYAHDISASSTKPFIKDRIKIEITEAVDSLQKINN